MDDCCIDKSCAIDGLRERQTAGLLRLVLLVNAAMFVVELVSGLLAGSVALLADSLDMRWRRPGLWLQSLRRGTRPGLESARFDREGGGDGTLWFVRLWAGRVQAAFPSAPGGRDNGCDRCSRAGRERRVSPCAIVRGIDVRSVWLCSRNDLVANTSVLLAAVAVRITLSPWPDIAVGMVLCAIFLRSALIVAREARAELKLNHLQRSAAAGRLG